MSSIANMANTLTASPWVAPKAPKEDKPTTKTEIMREYLRTHGWANSHTLAMEADVPKLSLVGALLKNDIASGKVLRERDGYVWNHSWDTQEFADIKAAIALLRRHGYVIHRKESEA